MNGRAAAIAATVVLTLVALYIEFWALVVLAMNCDESCGSGGSWRNDPDAWQWKAQLGWATAGLLLIAASIPLAARRDYRTAIGAVTVGTVVFATWAAFLSR